MPYVFRPPVRKMSWLGALAAAALFIFLLPSMARADDDDGGSYYTASPCPDVAVSNPFSVFGDYSDYTLVRGGDFESRADDWSLSRAGVVSGNESYYVGGESDSRSLSIGMFGKATSPRFCVDDRYPHFRFFARSSSPYGLLMVRARWTEDDDTEYETLGFLGGSVYGSWAPTAMLPLAEMLRLTDRRRTQHVRLVFTSLAGTWQIDDVYVDPYRR
jgi:hypothetical protein